MTESSRGWPASRVLLAGGVGVLLLGGLFVGAWSSSRADGDDGPGVIFVDGKNGKDRSVIVIRDGEILEGAPNVFVARGGKHRAGERVKVVITEGDDDGRGAYLGVALREETEHPEGGARITAVSPDSPADRAGLEEGDIIVGLGGDVIRGPMRLTEGIRSHSPGDEVKLDVIRDGSRKSFSVELGKRPKAFGLYWEGEEGPRVFSWDDENELRDHLEGLKDSLRDLDVEIRGLDCPEGEDCLKRLHIDVPHIEVPRLHGGLHGLILGRRPKLGVQLVEITPELRKHLGGSEDAGVLVAKVVPDMPAEDAGIRVGDLIAAADGEPVTDARDLIHALVDKDGKTIEIELIREGRSLRLNVEIPAREIEDLPTGARALRLGTSFPSVFPMESRA